MRVRVLLADTDAYGREVPLASMSLAEYHEHAEGARKLAERALAGDAEAEQTVKGVLDVALDLGAPRDVRVKAYFAANILRHAFETAAARPVVRESSPAVETAVSGAPEPGTCVHGRPDDVACFECASAQRGA